MVQAARSGKQNIIEGCAATPTSIKTGIKLLNVTKASLKELLEDFEDYQKVNKKSQWQKGSTEFEIMSNLGRNHNDYDFFRPIVESRPPETIANMAIILINQADYLLYRQIQSLSERFLRVGGFSERMSAERRKSRGY
ncbi:MAG: four helix bundle suffix domain-containing protein [Clostridium sp.]|nr:four helix bundle suffix domain-containing protein [Clostridium sp.]